MPVGIHTITLSTGASSEEFERFMSEELLPAARTVIKQRAALITFSQTLVRSRSDGEGNRVYLWITDVETSHEELVKIFPTRLGAALKAKLASFGIRVYAAYEALARAREDNITTPTQGNESLDEDGWVGSSPEPL
jgi:hypothetical protein